MRRKTFDTLMATAGLVVALVLLVAGALLAWGASFVDGQVHNQLAAQKIYFPPSNSPAIQAPEFAAMHPYAGALMTNGAQAEVYADHFIAVHLAAVAGGRTYAQVSSLAQADPTNTKLQGQVETLFKGTTLRSMLLNAYAFWKVGQIAGLAAVAAFVGAGLMVLLAGLGLWHSRRITPDVELLQRQNARTPATVAS
ncbi:MAG TPA: hypothetical protein VNE21_03780 [Mycobacteriales bacterium]|nr:hypothetical protein [Mycobacteriales bacterium]